MTAAHKSKSKSKSKKPATRSAGPSCASEMRLRLRLRFLLHDLDRMRREAEEWQWRVCVAEDREAVVRRETEALIVQAAALGDAGPVLTRMRELRRVGGGPTGVLRRKHEDARIRGDTPDAPHPLERWGVP